MIFRNLCDVKLGVLISATGLIACASQKNLHPVLQKPPASLQSSKTVLPPDDGFQASPLVIYRRGPNGHITLALIYNPETSYNKLPLAMYLAIDKSGFYTIENPAGVFIAAERMGPEAKDFYDQVLQAAATRYPLDARLSLLYRTNMNPTAYAQNTTEHSPLRQQLTPFPTAAALRQSLSDRPDTEDKISFLKQELGTLEAAQEPCYRAMLYAALSSFRPPTRSAYLRSIQKTMSICLREGDACAIAAAGDSLKDATGLDIRQRDRYSRLTQPYSAQCKSSPAP